jgi:hypothetical protein
MSAPISTGRETRLLVGTIAVSVVMLVLLARFRFPEEATRQVALPAVPPLERLAARATYDELAGMMAELERSIAPAIVTMRVEPSGTFVPAPRLAADLAVVMLSAGDHLANQPDGKIVGHETTRGFAAVAVPALPEIVALRTRDPRPGPRYVAVVEATAQGPVVRPLYVGRTELIADPRMDDSLLSIAVLRQAVGRGAAIFALDGTFIGLADDSQDRVTIIPAASLRSFAERARAGAVVRAELGVEVQSLTPALARASGADRGVMVSFVDPSGSAAGTIVTGDVIRTMGGTAVDTPGEFEGTTQTIAPGARVPIELARRGKPLAVVVVAGVVRERPTVPNGSQPGLVLRPVTGAVAEVVTVLPRTAAEHAGLRPDDVITAIDGREGDAGSLLRAYRGLPPRGSLLLTLQRGARHAVVALEKP